MKELEIALTEIEAQIENLKSERTALLATEQNLRHANTEILRWIDRAQDEAATLMAKHWSAQ